MLRERKQTEVVADHFAVQRQGLRERARVACNPSLKSAAQAP